MELTDQQEEVLASLPLGDVWVRPLDIGGTSQSHHSRILRRLVDLGLVERKERSARGSRPSYRYRITRLGESALDGKPIGD